MKTMAGWFVAILLLLMMIKCDAFIPMDPNECYGMTIGKSVKLKAPLDKQAPEIDLLLEKMVLAIQRRIPTKDASCIVTCDDQVVTMDGDVVTLI